MAFTSNRHECIHRMWRYTLLVWTCSLTWAVAGFVCQRLSYIFRVFLPVPQDFPYPDKALFALERYYDDLYPAGTDEIKFHGEWDRVRAIFWGAAAAPLIVGFAAAVVVVVLMYRSRESPSPGIRLWLLICLGIFVSTFIAPAVTYTELGMQLLGGAVFGSLIWLVCIYLPAFDRWRLNAHFPLREDQ